MHAIEPFDFLAARFADLAPAEAIEIRTFLPDGRPGPRAWFTDPRGAATYARGLPAHLATHYGVLPRIRGGGKKRHVTRVTTLWADVDDKCFRRGRTGALAALAAFPLVPSWIVDSGGGLHAYWHLRPPVAVADDLATVGRVEDLLRRLYARLGGLDAVHDLSRVLRLPGSLNGKHVPPRPVTIVARDPAAYRLGDFEVLLPPPPPPAPRRPAPTWRAIGPAGQPSPADVADLLRFIPPRGGYTDHWITVLAAVHALYPGPEGIALCEAWSPGHAGEIARKFASFGRYQGGRGRAGAGTLYYLARRHGWRPPAPDLALGGLRVRRASGLRVHAGEGVRRAGS